MQSQITRELFLKFQKHVEQEQELREKIRTIVKQIDQSAKEAATALQIIHWELEGVNPACLQSRQHFEECRKNYSLLAEVVPEGQYYRYCDHWHFLTQKIVFLIALTIYLEVGSLVSKDTAASILGLKSNQADGFHLDVEDYLMGVLQLATELARFATNSVTMGDYDRPLHISRFVGDLNAGFRLLNLKNDGLRKRFDALKYDVKKIEEVIYDITIRQLRSTQTSERTKAIKEAETEPSVGEAKSTDKPTADDA